VGIPLLVLPFFIEQPWNAVQLERLGMALHLSKSDLQVEDVAGKLGRLLREPNFTNNAKKAHEFFTDSMMDGLERGVFWLERHLRSQKVNFPSRSAKLSWTMFFYCDLLLLFHLAALIVSR